MAEGEEKNEFTNQNYTIIRLYFIISDTHEDAIP